MVKYNIPITNVLRHYDVMGKLCPELNVRDVKAWENFKAKLIENTKVKEEDKVMKQ